MKNINLIGGDTNAICNQKAKQVNYNRMCWTFQVALTLSVPNFFTMLQCCPAFISMTSRNPQWPYHAWDSWWPRTMEACVQS